MIPKKIHYIWFGGKELPELSLRCIRSWKINCPDYEIIKWDENKFNINENAYVKEAYEAGKFAFVSDYVRLYAIYTEGGIYIDTDVELLKPLDPYLNNEAFSGFESIRSVPTGVMGGERGCKVIKELLDYYNGRHFIRADGSYDMTTNCVAITGYFIKRGLILNDLYQVTDGFAFYPSHVFCPAHNKLNDNEYMKNAVAVHYFNGSWKSEKTKKRESSWWWKIIAVLGGFISRKLSVILGESYIKTKNRIRDKIFKND